MSAEAIRSDTVRTSAGVLPYDLCRVLRLHVIREVFPGGECIVASQNIEILAGEAGAGHGRRGPILTRFTRVPIDLVRDMRFVLEEIAFDKEDTVRGAPSGSHGYWGQPLQQPFRKTVPADQGIELKTPRTSCPRPDASTRFSKNPSTLARISTRLLDS